MIDFLRPLMFPVVLITITLSVWAMAWNKSMEDTIEATNRPGAAQVDGASDDELSADRPEVQQHATASHGCIDSIAE